MESYGHAQHAHTTTSHLTRLYTDAKRSAITSIAASQFVAQQQAGFQFAALHRKFRIQKDRLITWGLAWNHDEKGSSWSIDESFAKAGLTETVESVLENVKEITTELESVRSGAATKGGEKLKQAEFDEGRYEDLLKDLTASIDTLYDLSRSREALEKGEHPTFEGSTNVKASKSTAPYLAEPPKVSHTAPSIADSELTLVDPPAFARPLLSPYAGLPPRIDPSALRLPEEGPPPYASLGVPVITRLVGKLLRSRTSLSVQNALGSGVPEIPVLVEYADFDSTYLETGVSPPLSRLAAVGNAYLPMRPDSQRNISLLGYFEDSYRPRIGLVYDLPYSVQNRLYSTPARQAETFIPLSLLNLVKKASTETEPPPLELRFKLALRLTEQLRALHDLGLSHGNINSSSIIFATTDSENSSTRQKNLRSPLWSSPDIFSKCKIEGRGHATDFNIYRHPKDKPQASDRDLDIDLRFDLYSLALVLVEVGLWNPIGELYKPKYTLDDFKTRIEKLWTPKLSAKCGSLYMRAVRTLLRATDGGRLSRMQVYEEVLTLLRTCAILDDEGDDSAPAMQLPPADIQLPSSVPKRRPVPKSSGSSVPPRPPQLPLTRSISSSTSMSQMPHRTSSTPSISSSLAVPNAQRSMSDLREQITQRISSTPSFREYRSKVTLIQKRWRRYKELSRDARPGQHAEHASDTHTAGQHIHRSLNAVNDQSEPPSQSLHDRLRSKLTEFPLMDIPKAIRDDWNNRTAVELSRLVNHALKGSRESCSINLTSYGETPETARPTYLITCASTKNVKQILKRHFRFDPSTCHVRVEKGKITRCRKSRPEPVIRSVKRSMAPRYEQEVEAANPDYQPQPLCGASIGAYKDEEHLPPVSFGGVVTVDGRSYGMSVHHMLGMDEDEDEGADEEDSDSDTSSLISFNEDAKPLDSDDGSTVRQKSSPSDLSLDEELQADGDVSGILPGEGIDIEITQPALDDAIAVNLHADEEDDDDDEDSGVDEDHILSYKLGHVHASSGLKRSSAHGTEGGYRGISASLPQEIDWALIEILPPRVHPFNVVRGGRRHCDPSSSDKPDCFPVAVKHSSELAGARVHCLGRTSGLASGVISSTMELLRLHGRSTFSASYAVHGGFGVGGDSGAWVISSDGKVCGHVLAERAGRAYICPMELLFEDIKTTLGAAEVTLPTPHTEHGRHHKRSGFDQAISDAVARLSLVEGDSGGVPLPYPTQYQRLRGQAEPLRTQG